MLPMILFAFFCLALSTNEAGTKFLEENKNKPGVVTLPSGLQYKVITKGTGSVHPTLSTKVLCHYEGTLVDGTVFDSSYTRGEPITFAPKQVIKGWTEAMQLMVEGDKWELYLPADLAYGQRGSPPVIPGDSALIFKIEILKVPGEKKEEQRVPTSEPTAANRTEEAGGLPITTIAGIAVGFIILAYLWTTKYTFKAQTSDLEKLFKEVAVLNLPIEKKIEVLKERLSEAYPGRIYPEPEWFLNYAGGILCAIQVLYVSNWEYILIWGTPSGNEGLTGRHPFCQFHDTTLDGEVLYWSEKAPLRTQVFKTGDQWVHVFGDSGGQRIDGAGWAVEYCHGPMMSILPFGLVSVFCNSLDFWSYIKTLKIYALTMIYCNYLPNSFKTLPTKSASSSPSNSKRNKQKTK